MTPLHKAAERGYVKMVDYLIGKGADIGIQDKNGVIICDCFNNNWVWASLIHLRINQILVGYGED